jgi:predicted Zn-dependent peptidase
VIEASTMAEHLDDYFIEVGRLLREHVEVTDPVGLERARNQIVVRSLCAREVPSQRLEIAALDLYAFGRVRSREELMAGFAAVTPAQVRDAFARMQDAEAAVALAGDVGKGVADRVAGLLSRESGFV